MREGERRRLERPARESARGEESPVPAAPLLRREPPDLPDRSSERPFLSQDMFLGQPRAAGGTARRRGESGDGAAACPIAVSVRSRASSLGSTIQATAAEAEAEEEEETTTPRQRLSRPLRRRSLRRRNESAASAAPARPALGPRPPRRGPAEGEERAPGARLAATPRPPAASSPGRPAAAAAAARSVSSRRRCRSRRLAARRFSLWRPMAGREGAEDGFAEGSDARPAAAQGLFSGAGWAEMEVSFYVAEIGNK